MINILALLDLPDLSQFLDNPISVISQVLTSPFGVAGYIFILFALIAIVYSYNRNMESVGIFVILYGIPADILYPFQIVMMINFIGIGLIFGGVLWKAVFKQRGDY